MNVNRIFLQLSHALHSHFMSLALPRPGVHATFHLPWPSSNAMANPQHIEKTWLIEKLGTLINMPTLNWNTQELTSVYNSSDDM